MKWVAIGLGIIAVLILAIVGIGMALPRAHSATVRVRYGAPPELVYETIRDVGRGPEWRSGLQRVEVLSREGEAARWRETADWGTLTFERVVDEPQRRVVARIVDEGQGFGGTWTYEIEPAGTGSIVTITEDGLVDNPLYRFMTRFVMGYYASLETYARDLGHRLGEETQVERVQARGSGRQSLDSALLRGP